MGIFDKIFRRQTREAHRENSLANEIQLPNDQRLKVLQDCLDKNRARLTRIMRGSEIPLMTESERQRVLYQPPQTSAGELITSVTQCKIRILEILFEKGHVEKAEALKAVKDIDGKDRPSGFDDAWAVIRDYAEIGALRTE